MMRSKIGLLLLGLVWMVLAACAPVAEPSARPPTAEAELVEITFFSADPTAPANLPLTLRHVASGDAGECVTPCTVLTYAHHRYVATVQVEGYEQWTADFSHKTSGVARFPVWLVRRGYDG